MHKLLLAVLLICSFSVFAEDELEETNKIYFALCSQISGVGKDLLNLKYLGLTMEGSIKSLRRDLLADFLPVVKEIYSMPTFHSPDYIKSQSLEFENKLYLQCVNKFIK